LRRHSHRRRPFLRQRGVVDDQPCLVAADQRIGLFPQGRLKRTAVPKARTDEVMQAIIADFARPRRHRLDALAIPRTDQARDIGRAHPLPSLVAKALQKGRQPTLQINTPITIHRRHPSNVGSL